MVDSARRSSDPGPGARVPDAPRRAEAIVAAVLLALVALLASGPVRAADPEGPDEKPPSRTDELDTLVGGKAVPLDPSLPEALPEAAEPRAEAAEGPAPPEAPLGDAGAEEAREEAETAEPPADTAAPWRPPEPQRDGWDWMRMSSGEWLKGEVRLMRDDDLEFESDELDTLYLDWADVAEFRSSRVLTYVLDDLTTSTGTAVMREGMVAVGSGDEVQTFERRRLIAVVPGPDRELNYWHAKAGVGVSLRSGNTDSADLTGDVNLRRESPTTRSTFRYTGAYGVVDGDKNTNNHRGDTVFDVFLSRDFFVTPALLYAFSDEFQNIRYRLTPGAGLGYVFVRTPKTEWEVRTGGGWQYTRFDSVDRGDSHDAENGVVLLGTTLDTDITSRLDLLANYQLVLGIPDLGETNHHGDATFSFEINSLLDLDVMFVWDRLESPSREDNGDRPKRDDFRVSVGLSVDY